MNYDELLVLIPCHSLEDFPSELAEQPAEGLLNAFAVLWHPVLLAAAESLPQWRRADESQEVRPNCLILVPPPSVDWVPHGWGERARREGSHVVTGVTERQELLQACLQPLEETPDVDPDLAADFIAFGLCYLHSELLTRHMRNFSHVDEVHLQREAVAAAKAAVQNDRVAAETHLRYCYEMLLETRERYYPVECYLIDLCLVAPDLADKHLIDLLSHRAPCNLLGTAADWDAIAKQQPAVIEDAARGCRDKRIDLVGGEWSETCSTLLSIQSPIWQLQRGHETFRRLFDRVPTMWGRRKYGVDPYLPQILDHYGYAAALHVVMDDGIYPDHEHSKLRWSGCDGTTIDALSRIPLAADSAASFLRFPLRMSESMDHDQTAAVAFARWPELRTPWLDDFRRMTKYAPVLGRFVTFQQFFETGDLSGPLSEYKAGEYFSPTLIQSVARQQDDPISRHIDYWSRRSRFETFEWCRNVSQTLRSAAVDEAQHRMTDDLIESADPDADAEVKSSADECLAELEKSALPALSGLLAHDESRGPGILVVNPHSFPRNVLAEWPAGAPVPSLSDTIAARQFDDSQRAVVVKTPPCGFVWVSAQDSAAEPPGVGKTPMAEELVLRNDRCQVNLSEVTGGIGRLSGYGRGTNRISQQIAFRFRQERKVTSGSGDDVETYRTYYSDMVLRESRIISQGPVVGELETIGEIVDPQERTVLAGFRQVTRVVRSRPFVEIEIELDPQTLPEGDPWTSYYAVRFAWKEPTAALSRSLHGGAHAATGERIEAPQFIELADDETRTTILSRGLPFHRKTGSRMLDTILLTAGETRRRFRLAIALDEPYPIQAALDEAAPVLCVPTEGGPPGGMDSGWLFHLSSGNVQLTRILPLRTAESEEDSTPPAAGMIVRLLETEGLRTTTSLRCFRTPTLAREVDFQGKVMRTLDIDDDAVSIEVAPYEVCDIELRFDQ